MELTTLENLILNRLLEKDRAMNQSDLRRLTNRHRSVGGLTVTMFSHTLASLIAKGMVKQKEKIRQMREGNVKQCLYELTDNGKEYAQKTKDDHDD